MEWHFDDNMPIYTQLVYQIKFAIVSGELSPGEKMAGVRDLAADAGVNPNTMQRALQQLEREGLVFTQRSRAASSQRTPPPSARPSARLRGSISNSSWRQ